MADEQASATGAADAIGDGAARMGDAMRASGAKLVDSGSTLGARVIDQAESNAKHAFAAMRAAADAKDLSDVMRIQSEYLRDQGSRSMTQAREIGELIVQFGRDAVAPLRGGG